MKGVSSYTDSWEVTTGDFSWTLQNFNNNNKQWNYVKCGSKKAASIATITTNAAFASAIDKVVVTIDAITANSVNGIYLYVSDSSSFNGLTPIKPVGSTLEAGDLTFLIQEPSVNKFYQLAFDCQKSSNGIIQVSKVVYNVADLGNPDKETPKLEFAEASMSLEVGDTKAAPALTASVEGLSISYESSNKAVATCDAETGTVTAVGEGTTIITATSAKTEQYNSASASFTVTVTPKLELFSRATSVVSGQKYVLVADGKVTTGAVMINQNPVYEVPASRPYGYLQVTDVVVSDNAIHVPEKYALTVTAVDGGYSIQNYIGAYYYQQGGIYNTISLSTKANNQSVWNIEPQADGTMKIVGTDNHYLQLDAQHGTYGAYSEAKGSLPVLYQLGEVAPDMPEFDSDDTDVMIISAVGTTIYYRVVDVTSAAAVKRAADLEADGWIKNPDTENPNELMLSKDDLKGKAIEYMAVSASGLQSKVGKFVVADDGVVTGIEGIEAEAAEAEVEWFNLQGVRVANPESGLYIRRQGNKVEKVIVK